MNVNVNFVASRYFPARALTLPQTRGDLTAMTLVTDILRNGVAASLAGLALAVPTHAQIQPGDTLAQTYEEARGAPMGEAVRLTYFTETFEPGVRLREDAVTLWLGEDWAAWRSGDAEAVTIADLRTRRLLTLEPDEDTFENTSLFAEIRRRLDIYTQLSQGGQLDAIPFGAAGTFHRAWLEAAMGVAARPAGFEFLETERGFEAMFDGEVVAEILAPPLPLPQPGEGQRLGFHQAPEPGRCGLDQNDDAHSRLDLAIMALGHSTTVHPDILGQISTGGVLPCGLTFKVYSPESPQGRTEIWTLAEVDLSSAPFSARRTVTLGGADLLGLAGQAGLAASQGEAGIARDAASFYEDMLISQSQGDLSGAYLLTFQETHHFGPCPEQAIGSARLVCAESLSLGRMGIGNSAYERASEGIRAMQDGDHAYAVNQLAFFIDRDDQAGAAARILVANEMVAWGREGLTVRPDLDPAQLLAEALVIDPLAPDVYWHLGRRYLEAGAPDAAWTLFDLGRSLPGREPTPLLDQVDALESTLAQIAPALLPLGTEETDPPEF